MLPRYRVDFEHQQSQVGVKASSSFQVPKNVWKFLWALPIPPKLRHFWWRACNNLLASKVNLYRRRCATEALCPICHKESESVEHLLCGCAWTRAVWFGNSLSIPLVEGSIASIQQWTCEVYKAIADKHDRVDYVCKMIWLAWHIWKSRNNYVFNHLPIDPVATEKSFCESARHSIQSPLPSSLSSPAQDAPRTWSPSLPGRFKVNCDVAIKPGSLSAYMAVLIRDSEGYLMDGVVRMEEVGSVMQGEASAIRWACLVIRDLNLSQVEIVSDNKEVIRLCVSEDAPPWKCAPIIEDIRSLANLCNLSFLWTPRLANEAAHWTARAFLKGVLPSNWMRHHPEGLCKALASS
ncbi:hypothetical protein LOK49_LG03G01676 [Camellia lanceoleosa]|uniref:Uncharacterized protein n=1 Tax=Camellia lanceoleosa TaxID=1840588 RepID=A0ACC0IGP6_9ERIC|nr:hypothetical protein LOK49_LG03G01676 [Camellia lanceoleosa]